MKEIIRLIQRVLSPCIVKIGTVSLAASGTVVDRVLVILIALLALTRFFVEEMEGWQRNRHIYTCLPMLMHTLHNLLD